MSDSLHRNRHSVVHFKGILGVEWRRETKILCLQEAVSFLVLYSFPKVTTMSSSLKKGVAQSLYEPYSHFQAFAPVLNLFSATTHVTLRDGA